jgi:hypothetical protein
MAPPFERAHSIRDVSFRPMGDHDFRIELASVTNGLLAWLEKKKKAAMKPL